MNSVANWTNLEITALFLFGYGIALIVGFAWGYERAREHSTANDKGE